MYKGLSSPLGVIAIILIMVGVVLAIIGVILLLFNQNKTKPSVTWLLLIGGIIFGIIGGIILAISLSQNNHVENTTVIVYDTDN